MVVHSKLLSPLVKVFPEENPMSGWECTKLTALRGETVSFQIAYLADENQMATVTVESPIADNIVLRTVEYVQSNYPGEEKNMLRDGNYLRTKPSSFPDILRVLPKNKIKMWKNKYRTLWVDVEVTLRTKSGIYPITIILNDSNKNELCRTEQTLTIYNASLPKATLIHTEWFHSDCLIDYYGVEAFSDEYWRIVGNFMNTASKRGQNMILTPIFTPPLDTQIGGERTTVQLVDVYCNNAKWEFKFDKLEKWVDTAFKNGIEYFEISHLFTQWGANAAPKIMAHVDGEYKRVFGWDTEVKDGVYPAFLREFLPALTAKLKNMGISGLCYFHVSDEPNMQNIDNYNRAKDIIAPYLEDFKLMDALSNYEFYETGAVQLPIPASNHIQPFIDNNVPNLWTYYCVSQGYKVSNRFMALTLPRTRALGIQMFKYRIAGFLQWGYNFYNTRLSIEKVNPYEVTDCGGHYPSGDAFVVYPGENGVPEESIRLMAFYQAQTDLRALNALAEKTSFEYVLKIMEEGLPAPITFDCYPDSEYYYISLRNRVNAELSKNI